ncbi:MAG: hypothetical protein QXR87_06980 [Candidatus Hadarchaeales archaeon]
MRRGKLTKERALELAQMIGPWGLEVERKSLETLRRTLGEELTEELLERGEVSLISRGRQYVITRDAEVFELGPSGRSRVCVRVENEEQLPELGRVLAKYLVIRDQPERIFEYDEISTGIMYRELRDVVYRLQNRVEELEERLKQITGGGGKDPSQA